MHVRTRPNTLNDHSDLFKHCMFVVLDAVRDLKIYVPTEKQVNRFCFKIKLFDSRNLIDETIDKNKRTDRSDLFHRICVKSENGFATFFFQIPSNEFKLKMSNQHRKADGTKNESVPFYSKHKHLCCLESMEAPPENEVQILDRHKSKIISQIHQNTESIVFKALKEDLVSEEMFDKTCANVFMHHHIHVNHLALKIYQTIQHEMTHSDFERRNRHIYFLENKLRELGYFHPYYQLEYSWLSEIITCFI